MGRWIVLVLDTYARRHRGVDDGPLSAEAAQEHIGGGVIDGLVLVFRSPYLLAIVASMAFTNVAGAVFYLQQSEILKEHLVERAARGVFLADINTWSNGIALLGQLFLNAWILRRVGPGIALLGLPVVVFAALAALGWVQWNGSAPPVILGTFAAAEIARRSANFALSRPTREYLFTLVSPSAKYRSKNFIDTAVYRGVDVAASAAERGLRAGVGLPLYGVAFAFLPLIGAWAALALVLGRLARIRVRTGAEPPSTPRTMDRTVNPTGDRAGGNGV